MKKRTIFFLTGTLGVSLLLGGVMYSTNAIAGWNKNTLSLIDMFKANQNVKETGEVKFKVNGQPITKRYFETEKNYYIYRNKADGTPIPSDKEITNTIAKKEALYQKALAMGLEASDQEVAEFLKKQKDIFYSNDPNISGNQEIRAAVQASGQSEEEFWKDCEVEYKKILTTEKLTNKLLKEMGPIQETVENIPKMTEFLDKKYKEITDGAKIEMVNQ